VRNNHESDDPEATLTTEEEAVVWTNYPMLSKTPYIYTYEYAVARGILDPSNRNRIVESSHSSPRDNSNNGKEETERKEDKSEAVGKEQHPTTTEESVVGVKSHHQKKSNAVGDPDGDDSDDDDDDYSDITDEEWEMEFTLEDHTSNNIELKEQPSPSTQVQVNVELLGEEGQDRFGGTTASPLADVSSGGGVGIKLGSRLKNYRRNKKEQKKRIVGLSSSSSSNSNHVEDGETQMVLQAWLPHIYLPPTPAACDFLQQHARSMDAASKVRLDRRTLYSGLLLEWNTLSMMGDSSKTNHSKSTSSSSSATTTTATTQQQSRKFLDAVTSQSLQAAMSLATQPQWRQAYRLSSSSSSSSTQDGATSLFSNGLRFYYKEGEGNVADKAPTLGMQETIAMALVSCGSLPFLPP
jgi:hypothetical protein